MDQHEQFLRDAIFQMERLVEISEANTARQKSLLNTLRDMEQKADDLIEKVRSI